MKILAFLMLSIMFCSSAQECRQAPQSSYISIANIPHEAVILAFYSEVSLFASEPLEPEEIEKATQALFQNGYVKEVSHARRGYNVRLYLRFDSTFPERLDVTGYEACFDSGTVERVRMRLVQHRSC